MCFNPKCPWYRDRHWRDKDKTQKPLLNKLPQAGVSQFSKEGICEVLRDCAVSDVLAAYHEDQNVTPSIHIKSQTWGCILVIPALGRLRQAGSWACRPSNLAYLMIPGESTCLNKQVE